MDWNGSASHRRSLVRRYAPLVSWQRRWRRTSNLRMHAKVAVLLTAALERIT